MSHDVIVIGLGGMGSAACREIAARGQRVIGFDRHHPPHDLGGTHGRSRIIRQAYMEAPEYVPLLLAAYAGWRALEAESGGRLLTITGGLMLGRPDSDAVAGSLESARTHDLPHELLDADTIRRRFPAFHVDDETVALFEDQAGVVDPERGVGAFLDGARAHGAELRLGEAVTGWAATKNGVEVHTTRASYEAGRLVITPGPWGPELLRGLGCELVPSREVMHWFAPPRGIDPFLPDRFPIYIWEPPTGDVFYGFPALDGPEGGVKVAIHHGGSPTDPTAVNRVVGMEDVEAMRACLSGRIPDLLGEPIHAAVCLYTNTPDRHFVLGLHPEYERVSIAAGLSGHGYKFAPVIGAILADLALDGTTAHPIAPFSPGRFSDPVATR